MTDEPDRDIDPFEEYSPFIDPGVYAKQFEQRNERLRLAIQAAAEHPNIDAHGAQTEAANAVGIDPSRVTYVLEKWGHLVEWYQVHNASPNDDEELEAVYDEFFGGLDDDTETADTPTVPAGDGGDGLTLTFTWTVDKAIRALGILPNDMKRDMARQMMVQSADINPEELSRAFGVDDNR